MVFVATFVIVKMPWRTSALFCLWDSGFSWLFTLAALSYKDIPKIRFSTLTPLTVRLFYVSVTHFKPLAQIYLITPVYNRGIGSFSTGNLPLTNRKNPAIPADGNNGGYGLIFISFPSGSFNLNGTYWFNLCLWVCDAHYFVDLYSHKHSAVAITQCKSFVSLVCYYPGDADLSSFLSNACHHHHYRSLVHWYLVQNYMQRFSTPTRFAVVLTTEPVFAALAGYWWAGEHLGPLGLIGAGLILLAMLISTIFNRS